MTEPEESAVEPEEEPPKPPEPPEPQEPQEPPEPLGTPRSKLITRYLRLLLLVLTLGLAMKGIHSLVPRDDEPPGIQPVPVPPVRVLTLEEEQLSTQEERYGRLVPVQQWTLALEVGGRIEERPAHNGKTCRGDELLVALDPKPFEAEVAAAEARVKEAKAALDMRVATLTRLEGMKATTTKERLDQATSARDRAAASLAAAEAQKLQAEYRHDHTKLLAPTSGVVSELRVEAHDFVAPGQPLGTYSRVDVLLVKLLVSWEVRRGVTLRQPAQVIDGQERLHSATLVRAATVQTRDRGQFELEFEVDNSRGQLLSGEPVRCRFEHGATSPRLRIPRQSLYEEYGMWRALVVEGPSGRDEKPFRAGSTPVVLGESEPNEGWVEVLSGLKAGDRVLVPDRVAAIREGQRVVTGPVAGSIWLPPYARTSGK